MKKNSLKRGIRSTSIWTVVLLFSLAAYSRAEENVDLNARFAFKKIFVSFPKDNVDGAYTQPVSEAFSSIFEKNTRFELVDNLELADTIVESFIEKKVSGTDLEIRLTLNPSQEPYVIERTSIKPGASGGELVDSLKQLLKAALKRIPFYGTITGKDGDSFTFDIGTTQGLLVGDVVQISRVERVKRHPLLKTIVDVELVPVGSVEITEAEDAIAFGKLHKTLTGEEIQRLYKVTAIESRIPQEKAPEVDPVTGRPVITRTSDEIGTEEERPRIGFMHLGVFMGTFSSTSSAAGGSSNFSGSAFAPGVKVGSELWITKNWFADLNLGFNFLSYSQAKTTDTRIESPTTSQTTRSLDLNFGYKYLIQKSIFGPQAFFKIGYRNFSWNPTVSTRELVYPKSYSGFNVGVGGSMPVGAPDFGILTSINIILFGSLDESGNRTGPGESSMSAVNFFLGGYHYINLKIALRAGFFFDSYSADFTGTSETSASTSQKQVGFLPSILYYF